ncbi:hypothetical protein [Enterococcus entomosocium]|nr:hypothetical protein [Enterococcus entomosocium]
MTIHMISSFEEYLQLIDQEILEKIVFDYPKLAAYYEHFKNSI